ncbi:MAG: phosphoglycerate mutase (2,3-diphosphoglycerate-independent), partial [Smithellaceae bacterium]|nr:phosphoglycerate mutase (2,3-diphosphoglycerate-independent) [Smithellaceae bacterium]
MRSETTFPMSRAILGAYAEGQEDETLLPLVGVNSQQAPLGRIQPGDSIIFYNIRGEREIELSRSFTEKNFREFPVHPELPVHFTTMIEYSKNLNTRVAFPPRDVLSDT